MLYPLCWETPSRRIGLVAQYVDAGALLGPLATLIRRAVGRSLGPEDRAVLLEGLAL